MNHAPIDIEIRGPIANKDYESIKRRLSAAEPVQTEKRVSLIYKDRGFNNREVWLEQKGERVELRMHTGKPGAREEIALPLGADTFSDAVHLLAELGYKKGTARAEEVTVCRFGGATIYLHEPESGHYYYEATMTAGDPTTAKESKAHLETLAKRFKLPMWTPLQMLEYSRMLAGTLDYEYDYEVQGPEHFKERYGI